MGGLIFGRYIRDRAHANGRVRAVYPPFRRYDPRWSDLPVATAYARAGKDAPPTGLVGVLWELYRAKISIAFANRSFDPNQSVDRSLSVRLIPPYKYTTNVQNRAQARLIKPRIT